MSFANTNRSLANDKAKSATLGSRSSQQIIIDNNKRRTVLQDNSWIKKKAEDEIENENYGKAALSRHRSEHALDRIPCDEVNSSKPIHNKFRSEDALDKIPGKVGVGADSGRKAATLERVSVGSVSSDKTSVAQNRQSWTPGDKITSTTQERTRSDHDAPAKPRINLVESARAKFQKLDERPKVPPPLCSPTSRTPSVAPQIPTRTDSLPSPTKDSSNRRSMAERKMRDQDLDNQIEVKNTAKPSRKDQELDNLIEIKSTAKAKSKDEELDNLIEIKSTAGRSRKRDDELDNLIEIKSTAGNQNKRGDVLDNIIEVKSTAGNRRDGGLDNLIDVKSPTGNRGKTGGALDNLIEVKSTAGEKRDGGLDNLIDVKSPTGNRGKIDKGLDNLIEINRTAGKSSTGKGLDNLIDVKHSAGRDNTRGQDLDHLIHISNTAGNTGDGNRMTSQSSGVTVTRDPYSSSTKTTTTTRTVEYSYDGTDIPRSRSSTNYSYDTRRGPSYNTPDGYSTDTYVYTTTYDENSKPPNNLYDDSVTAKTIKTVYSTADRTVIEKEMCTYCRKPLGIETKMILDELHICCHATCFKCEVCGRPLGDLKAGDSMWIYRQTVHCDSCYSGVKEKWIM